MSDLRKETAPRSRRNVVRERDAPLLRISLTKGWNLGGGGVRVMLVGMEIAAGTADERVQQPLDVDEFCRRAHPRLVRTLTAATGDVSLADEITQEALARAWERWDRVSRLDQPEAWCYRVAMNLARSQFRRRAAARRAHDRMPAASTAVDGAASTDDELMTALRRLPELQRSVLALRFLADLSVESTADVLRMPIGTVKSTTSRALAELRTILDPRPDTEAPDA